MGAKLFKQQILKKQIPEKDNVNVYDLEFLSLQKLDEDFDRLYLESREKLRAITVNPGEELMGNISRSLKTNAKFIKSCFKEAESYRYKFVDLITDQPKHNSGDFNVHSTDSRYVDSCLRASTKRITRHNSKSPDSN